MTDHLLYSEDFTGEIRTFVKPDGVPIPEITTVGGWTPFWREVPDDTIYRPEMEVIDAVAPYLDPPRTNGERGLKIHKLYSRHDAGYFKQYIIPAGLASLSAQLGGHAWYSQRDNADVSEYKDEHDAWHQIIDFQPGMTLWIGTDAAGGTDPWADTVQWNYGSFYDGHGMVQSGTVFNPSSLITLFIRSFVDNPFKHADMYFSNVWLNGYSDDPEEPEPPTPEPEVEYEVVVNLLPQDATKAEKAYVLDLVHESRQTILQSADDAARLVAAGAPGSRVKVWDEYRFPNNLGEWLLGKGVDCIEYWMLPSDSGPTPEPPPDPEPQYTLRSNNLIGLHSGFTKAQSFPYILNSGTTIQKFFSAGDAYEAAKIAPGIVSVWRKYVGNEQGRIWQEPTIRESAAWYLQQYTAEIETARTNMGLTLAQFLERRIALESLNETIPTNNESVLRDAVEFDVHFCELAHERYGDAIDTVLLCGAIGNPHESEVPLLLPAAKIAAQWEDFIGYHAYWTANEHRSFLDRHWFYHAGRWAEWDTYFRSQGVYPRYASGEGGIVYAWDGQSFDSGRGWRACGSFERYLADIDAFNSKCLAWNMCHGNRFAGLTLFGYANWGWDNFELGDGEVILLNEWAQGL